MRESWRLIDSGSADAGENMAIDEAIALHVIRGATLPTVRFYSWDSPSISIGCFQNLSDIDTETCEELSIPIVRRPTGGRAILHCSGITYSFSAQNSDHAGFRDLMNTYSVISAVFFSAFKVLGLDVRIKRRREKGRVLARNPHCFEAISFGELVVDDRKIIGSAQKRYRTGFLQQGSIPFHIDKRLYHEVFGNRTDPVGLSDLSQDIDENDLKASIKSSFENVFKRNLTEGQLSGDESSLARKLLVEKYRSPEWIHRR